MIEIDAVDQITGVLVARSVSRSRSKRSSMNFSTDENSRVVWLMWPRPAQGERVHERARLQAKFLDKIGAKRSEPPATWVLST